MYNSVASTLPTVEAREPPTHLIAQKLIVVRAKIAEPHRLEPDLEEALPECSTGQRKWYRKSA